MATATKTETVTLTFTPDEASLIRRALFLYAASAINVQPDVANEIRSAISVALYPF